MRRGQRRQQGKNGLQFFSPVITLQALLKDLLKLQRATQKPRRNHRGANSRIHFPRPNINNIIDCTGNNIAAASTTSDGDDSVLVSNLVREKKNVAPECGREWERLKALYSACEC